MKRELSNLRDKIESADRQLRAIASRARSEGDDVVAEMLTEVRTRDLAEALRTVNYLEEVS